MSLKDESLLNTDQATFSEEIEVTNNYDPNKLSKKFMGILAGIVALSTIVFILALAMNKNDGNIIVVPPIKLWIALPQQSPFPISLGESRVLQVLFYSGNDDRTLDNYRSVTQKEVIWTVDKQGIIQIDTYGRLGTISPGTVTVRVQSKNNADIFAQRTIDVVVNQGNYQPLPKRVIDYEGQAFGMNPVLQKYVHYYTLEDAKNLDSIPQSIKDVINNPQAERKTIVEQQIDVKWSVVKYADKSNRTFIKRESPHEINPRDRIMYLIGNRYIYGSGVEVLSIEDNGGSGLWTVNSLGVTHIELKEVSYKEKAEIMVEDTRKYVMRHGLASDSYFSNGQWVGAISDNDGLWTSMFAAGEFMRYSSLKANKFPDTDILKARDSALYSLKAILLISNIAMRNITIDAKIRHYNNTRLGSGEKLSSSFLKQGKPFAVDSYVGSPADGQGFFGNDAGKTVDGTFVGGKFRYSFLPTHKDDWTDNRNEPAATSKRILNGYISRTFVIESKDGKPPGGLFFKHNDDDKQYVASEANKLYDYTSDQHPTLNLGSTDLPQILKDFLIKQGGSYNKSDLYYKGDTSTDEVIGHLFIYKIAFDILDQNDPEQKILKQLIKSTMVNFCTCLTNNDYTMVDATGQGTSWAKLTRIFISSDFTIEDAPLKSLQLLMSFKLCHYVTGDPRWKKEYEFLIEDPNFKYLDLVASVWKRWTYRAFNEDSYAELNMLHLDPNVAYTETQITRHIIANIHFSDEEEAYLGYYLAFQLEDNEDYLAKYRKGLEGWWHSISRSQNPLWYYIYQLAYPKDPKKDYYKNSLTQIASWQLSRHQIDTTRTVAFIEGSRDDVFMEGNDKYSTISMNPAIILEQRKQKSDAQYFKREINQKVVQDYNPLKIYEIKVLPADERSIHKFNGATFEGINGGNPNSMQPSTTYTLPYWMGVYHKMLKPF